jgi:hypothetical protein
MDTVAQFFPAAILFAAGWMIVIWIRDAKKLKAGANDAVPHSGVRGHVQQARMVMLQDAYRAERNIKAARGELGPSKIGPMLFVRGRADLLAN